VELSSDISYNYVSRYNCALKKKKATDRIHHGFAGEWDMVMRCYECGRIMKRVDNNPESYECECGYAVRRLTKEESKLFVKMTIP